ncbi:SdrD B-like domain-containing protein [Methanimicrococcus hongohii]|nr:SdrD B-like domain-containing protein [Methanimicrococcus sp. Hf6]
MVAPVAATDISADWSDNSGVSTTKILQPTNSSSLIYKITSTSTANIELELTIENANNSNYGVGFNLTYPTEYVGTEDNYFAEVLSHSYNYDSGTNKGTLKMVLEPNASVFDLNIVVTADAKKVYHNETAEINAKITQAGSTKTADAATVKARIPSITSSGSYILNNPSRLATGADEVDIGLYYGPNISALSVAGFRIYADSITFNFSNITVYADGFTGNLSEWKTNNGGTDILTFEEFLNGTYIITVDSDNYTVTFTPKSGQFTLAGAFYLPLKIKTDSNFTDTPANTTAPSISFTNVMLTAENMTFNGRGPVITSFKSGTSTDGSTYGWGTGGSKFTAVKSGDDHLSVKLNAPTGANGDMNRNIINADAGIFEYQNLFKAQITNSVRNGSDETIDFEIPTGLKVTHIRVPSYSNEQTKYTAVSIWDRANNTFVSLAPAVTTNLTQYGYGDGENITLKIENVLRMYPSPSAASTESASHMITFIGQITDTNTTPVSFTFNASRNGSALDNISAGLTITVRDSYIVMPYHAYGNGILTDSKTSYAGTPSLVQRGDTFYMFTSYSASSYPYNSVLRFNPMNVGGTTAVSNPVIYFNIPNGLVVTGDPEVTYSNGTVKTYNSYSGTPLTFTTKTYENEGIYGSEGGYVVEVKYNVDNSNTGTFWARDANIRLPVTVADDYEGTGFTFEPYSILVSTWDPNAYDVYMSGSGGRVYKLSDVFSSSNLSTIASSVTHSTYPQYIYQSFVEVASDASVSASTSVKMSTGYVSYKSGTTTTYPELHAGSQNEEFKISFKNKLSSLTDDAVVYFVLPSNDEWAPKLLSPNLGDTDLNISLSGDLDRGNITVYYTTEALGNENSLTDMGGLTTWVEITSVNLQSIIWDDVTAIRCDVINAPGDSGFDLYLKFYMPDLEAAALSDEDQLVLGQTLYDINISGFDPITSETGATAAIKIKASLPPQIIDIAGVDFVTSSDVEFRTDSVSNKFYDGFIVRDDFSDVKLDQIIVKYKEPGSTEFIVQSQYSYDSTNLSDAVTSVTYSDTISGQDWKGYKYTLKDSLKTYIQNMNQTLGEYSVTLISTTDNDLNPASATYTIKVSKNESNVTLTLNNNSVEYEMNSANTLPLYLPDGSTPTDGSYTWTEYLTYFVDVNDYGDVHNVSRFVKAESSNFTNIAEPGKFFMNYTYISPGLTDSKSVSVPVTVVLYDDLTVKAVADGQSLDGLTVYVDDGVLSPIVPLNYDSDLSGYPTFIKGSYSDPKNASYAIYYSGFPSGLKDVNGGVSDGYGNLTVDYSVEYGAESYTRARVLNFDPIKFEATASGDTDGIYSVSLYKVDTEDELIDSPIIQDKETPQSVFTFDKESGEGWYSDGGYYVSVQLIPGYQLSASSGFVQDSDNSLIWTSSPENLNSADVSFAFTVEQAPFVSGLVWVDSNKDSTMDVGEKLLSDVEVQLYNSTNDLIGTAKSLDDGYYYFYGMPEDDYYVKVIVPSGYRLSEFDVDQTVSKTNDNSSDVFTLDSSTPWKEAMYVGLYRTDNSGSGFGQAYVVASASGGTVLVESPEGEIREPGFTTPLDVIETKRTQFPWYLLILGLLVVIVCVGAAVMYQKSRGRV